MKTISRVEIEDLLDSWSKGAISDKDVHEWGQSHYCISNIDVEDWEENGSISVANSVLAELDQLDMNLRTKEDISILKECLNAPAGCGARAISTMQKLLSKIDLQTRAKELKENPVYEPFCKRA